MFSAPFLVTLLDRVKAVVRRVAQPGVKHVRRVPEAACAAASPPVSPLLRGLAKVWMDTRLRALSALIRRIEAGERFEAPTRPHRVARRVDASGAREPAAPDMRLPRGSGWMCPLGPDVRKDGQAFAAWLSEPAMKARVLAEPQRMARLISPTLTATGACRPEWFAAEAKRGNKAPRIREPEQRADVAWTCGAGHAGSEIREGAPPDSQCRRVASVHAFGINAHFASFASQPNPTRREVFLSDSATPGIDYCCESKTFIAMPGLRSPRTVARLRRSKHIRGAILKNETVHTREMLALFVTISKRFK
jgi:hypothetical protein